MLVMMRTGRDGRYLLADLPRRRIVLTASRPGYYTHHAAGRSGSRVILDCSSGCATKETDFDLVRGGVITGSVVDKLQEPVDRVQVSAHCANKIIPVEPDSQVEIDLRAAP